MVTKCKPGVKERHDIGVIDLFKRCTVHLLVFKLKNCAPVWTFKTGVIHSGSKMLCLDHVKSPCLKCFKSSTCVWQNRSLDFVPHTCFSGVKTCKNYWNWLAGFCACAPILRVERQLSNLYSIHTHQLRASAIPKVIQKFIIHYTCLDLGWGRQGGLPSQVEEGWKFKMWVSSLLPWFEQNRQNVANMARKKNQN